MTGPIGVLWGRKYLQAEFLSQSAGFWRFFDFSVSAAQRRNDTSSGTRAVPPVFSVKSMFGWAVSPINHESSHLPHSGPVTSSLPLLFKAQKISCQVLPQIPRYKELTNPPPVYLMMSAQWGGGSPTERERATEYLVLPFGGWKRCRRGLWILNKTSPPLVLMRSNEERE